MQLQLYLELNYNPIRVLKGLTMWVIATLTMGSLNPKP